MKNYLLLFLFLSTRLLMAGDILTLNNELVYEGKIKKVKKSKVIFFMNDQKYVIPAEEVFSIQFENTNDPVYTSYLKTVDAETNACEQGRFDATYLHGKKGGHFVLGFLFGPFAIIGTAVADPNPFNGARMHQSKNQNLFSDPLYISCYSSKAKGQLIGMELLGWGSAIVLILLL